MWLVQIVRLIFDVVRFVVASVVLRMWRFQARSGGELLMAIPYVSQREMQGFNDDCADQRSTVTKRTILQFGNVAQMPLAHRLKLALFFIAHDAGNILRCMLSAKAISPDELTKFDGEGPPNRPDADVPLLAFAAAGGSVNCVRALINAGANLDAKDSAGETALHLAAQHPETSPPNTVLASLNILLFAGADPNAVNKIGETPLIRALAEHAAEHVKLLVPVTDLSLKGSLTDGTADMFGNALHYAVIAKSEECFDIVLPHIGDAALDEPTTGAIMAADDALSQLTALHLAALRSQPHMVDALLKRGADPMALDSFGQTPLHWAAQAGSLGCVQCLLQEMDAEQVNSPDLLRRTPLHEAAQKGSDSVCCALIKAGARVNAQDREKKTPLMHALEKHPDSATLISLLRTRRRTK